MVTFKSEYAPWDFAQEAKTKQRYFFSPKSQEFLAAVAETSVSRISIIKQGYRVWRAQVGAVWQYGGAGRWFYVPLPEERMFPLRDRATEGRVNPKGMPCLYVATTREAAMSEVRPWIGSRISVALMETTRDLKIMDCSKFHNVKTTYSHARRSSAEIEREVWIRIDDAFSTPVARSDDAAEYAATQILADLFKSRGADGVLYKSAFGEDGYNIALFDLAAATILEQHLYLTSNAKFDFEQDRFASRYKTDRPISK